MEQADLAEKPFLFLSRTYPVATEKVWRAWTEPEAIKGWFGPGASDPVAVAELDVRVGGRFRIVFGGAQGTDHEVQGVYKAVEPYRRLVFTWSWPRTTPERESLVSITFRAVPGGTELLFRHDQFFDERARDGHKEGWSEAFVKLERLLRETSGKATPLYALR